ncbi:hypothetical protein [Conexibacter sp. DBS9H8]|uniref:hypothetical protein n=1 Tax=Conexibacter sp. DBS9H8 TaxID=2937801 RepID=UPI00200EF0E2|nr:hypothetical protein [Conexibacter sp. DBS9H8]
MRLLALVLLIIAATATVASAATTTSASLPAGIPPAVPTTRLVTSVPWLPATTTPTATTTTTTTTPAGNLPFTGLDLWPETVASVLLIGAGVTIRLRISPRRR